MHSAFSLTPVDVITETRLTPLLAKVPSFFDQYEVGHSGKAKVFEFKCKGKVVKMPINIYKMGLALCISRIWRDSLMEQLTGQREEPEAFERKSQNILSTIFLRFMCFHYVYNINAF